MSHNYTLSIDLEVLKELTRRIESEGQDHNDVLRELLSIDSPLEPDEKIQPYSVVSEALSKAVYRGEAFYSRGLSLPEGTVLRARYKGNPYRAEIKNFEFVTEDGAAHDSPSAAASHITENNVNGLRFWEAQLPFTNGWVRLDHLRQEQSS